MLIRSFVSRVGCVALLLAIAPLAAQTVEVAVDVGAERQSIDGFGATIKSLIYAQDVLTPSQRAAALEAVFQEVGITTGGLQLAVERGQNDNDDPGELAAAGFDWTLTSNMLSGIVDPGRSLGLTDAYPAYKIDQRVSLSWMVPIRDQDYDRYLDEVAENVLATLLHWRDEVGRTPPLLQLFNEPTSGNRELRSSTGSRATVPIQEVVDIVKRVGARVRAAGFEDVRFVVPNEETVARSTLVARAILEDPEARPYVGAIGYHPYPYRSAYTSPRRILEQSGAGRPDATAVAQRQALADLVAPYGLPLWMTEVSEGPTTQDFPFGDVRDVRARAIHIHDEFRYATASAYYGMSLLWDKRSHVDHFGNPTYTKESSSMVLIDNDTGRLDITGMGYAVGHYARWLAPGAVRVEAESPDPLVLLSAFYDAARGRTTLVVLNNKAQSVRLEVTLTGVDTVASVQGEASYGDVRWGPAPDVAVEGRRLTMTLPPESVVSLGVASTAQAGAADTPSEPGTRLSPPYPNPTSGTATVPFALEDAGPARLEVVDALGRVVRVLSDGDRPAGAHEVGVPAGLAPGAYAVRLVTPRAQVSTPLVVTR